MTSSLITRAAAFAKQAHEGQTRKYTGEPYFNHVEAVAKMVGRWTSDPETVAAAYLHDVLEDTKVPYEELFTLFGPAVAMTVLELTDFYTPEAFPDFNRAKRKSLEAQRLAGVSVRAKIIKMADIEDNTKTITAYDPKFASTYLREKLEVMTALAMSQLKPAGSA